MKKLLCMLVGLSLVATLGCSSKNDAKINFIFKDAPKPELVAKIGVKEINGTELFKGMEDVLAQAEIKEFDVRFNRLRAHVLEHFMKSDARKGSLSNDEYLEKYVLPKNVSVTDKDVAALAKEKGITAEQMNNPEMKEKIKFFIGMQKKRDLVEQWLRAQTKTVPVVVFMTLPAGKEKLIADAVPSFTFKPADGKKVLEIGTTSFSEEELFAPIRNEIFEAQMELYNVKLNALKALLVDEFVALDSKSKDMKVEEYLDKHVYQKVEVKPEQIEAFIKEKNIPATAVNDQLKERVKDYMGNMARQEHLEAWIAKKSQSVPVEVYFSAPVRPVFTVDVKDSIFWGKEDAKVTIVEFTDFECPYCSKGSQVMKELKEHYGNKIKVVFKHFPLPFHENARLAHQMGICLAEQKNDLFWKAYESFFADQTKLGANDLRESIKKVGGDLAKIDECLKTDRAEAIIKRDFEQGQQLGVNSTPTFYVNGQLINGAQDVSVFKELIDAELKK